MWCDFGILGAGIYQALGREEKVNENSQLHTGVLHQTPGRRGFIGRRMSEHARFLPRAVSGGVLWEVAGGPVIAKR